MFVITADQKRSARRGDRVPEALEDLAAVSHGAGLPFERTVGDEVQALLDSPGAVVEAVARLTRLGGWRLGIGVGPVEEPLPATTRAASGPAFLAAREAVTQARSSPVDLRVVRAGVGGRDYGLDEPAHRAESALWLLVAVLRRRTPEGWEIAGMAGEGMTGRAMAERLGISPSAVSQRLARAGVTEARRGAELAAALLGEADR
ncbi:MAG TPA: hypothetical protein VH915_01895 [Pedococcus sp.]|jgi:hypothetical protein